MVCFLCKSSIFVSAYCRLSLTRDTSENDIKQRREIRDGNALFQDLVNLDLLELATDSKSVFFSAQ